MSRNQKWQDVTLMNSKCSEVGSDESHSIYRAIIKSLKGDRCTQHNKKYNYYYSGKLLCSECFSNEVLSHNRSISDETKRKYEFLYNLQTILNHPIVLVIHEKDILAYPIEIIQLMVHSYKQLYHKKSDFKLKKVLVQSFIKRIKNRIDQLCQDILDNFSEMEDNITKQSDLRQDLSGLAMMYQQQLLDMLAEKFVQNKKQELQQLLQEYSRKNEDPFPKISKNMSEMMNCLAETPSLDISALQKIYTSVTDELLWNPKKIVVPQKDYFQNLFETANIIINNEQVVLQSQYTLKIQQYQISLFMEKTQIGKLDLAIDSLYMLPHYKLIGVNYSKIVIINYFDQLTIQAEYQITGCTDILPFSDHILAISNQKLIKINLTTKTHQIIGLNYTDLRYCKNKPSFFACENQQRTTTYWNIWSNTPLSNLL